MPFQSKLLIAIRISLLIGGLCISIYQSVTILKTFISQPTLGTSEPKTFPKLKRPDVVICKNIIKLVLSDAAYRHERGDVNIDEFKSFGQLASISGQLIPSLYVDHRGPKASLMKDELRKIVERRLSKAATLYEKCTDVLGSCSVSADKFSYYQWPCCSQHETFATEHSVCHRVRVPSGDDSNIFQSDYQSQRGEHGAAVYEVKFGTNEASDASYHVYLLQSGEAWDGLKADPTYFQTGQEVKIWIRLKQSRLLKSDKQCTDSLDLVNPRCSQKTDERMIALKCKCNTKKSVWFRGNNAMSRKSDIRDIDDLRPCNLFEGTNCLDQMNSSEKVNYERWNGRCVQYLCASATFLVDSENDDIPAYMQTYMKNTFASPDNTSILYVYYDRLVVTIEKELQILSPLTVISALGGIWGIWLGWSVYDMVMTVVKAIMVQGIWSKKIRRKRKKSSIHKPK